MHPARTRQHALGLLREGLSASEVSRTTGVPRSTIRSWVGADPIRPPSCPRCGGAPLDEAAYAAVLGYYLGDGCISASARYFSLRISCDDRWPGIIADVTDLLGALHSARPVHHVRAEGCTVVQSNWQHWPCLFPQHGPGRKHERPIVLDAWQAEVVTSHPGAFLRGLFHSDGCRVRNWTERPVAGQVKRYEYPRWQFDNRSADIRELCCWALDLVDVAWRQSNRFTISVSRREAVARLDALIGPKS